MPSKSKAQQKFMGAVYALQKGDVKPSDVTPAVRKVAKDMKKSDAKDFASTKHKGLPKKVKQEIVRRLKQEMKDAGPVVGSYAIPSFQKKRKHKDTDNLGKRNKNGNSGQPDIEEGSFTRHSQVQGYHPQGGLNHHVLNKSKNRKHDDDANFKKKNSGQDDIDEDALNEVGVFDVKIFLKDMIPIRMRNTVNRQNKEQYDSVVDDLVHTLNRFWKKHKIPYRVRNK